MKAGDSYTDFGRRAILGVAIGLVAALILGLLTLAKVFESPELLVFDAMQRAFGEREAIDEDIVLVTIDQASLEKVEKTIGHRYPWPRALYALALRFIERGGPRAVVFDLLFEGVSPGSDEQDGNELDVQFADAIHRATGVVLGFKMRPPDPTPPSRNSRRLLDEAARKEAAWPHLADFGRIDPLAGPLIESGAAFGFVNASPESDGVVRRAHLLADVQGHMVPSLALAALLAAGKGEVGEAGRFTVDGRAVSVSGDGRAWIRFHGAGGIEDGRGRTYPYIPFANVLFSAIQAEQGAAPIMQPGFFGDKWVIIGSTAAAGFDLKATPFSKEGTFPGMEIQATVLDNLLHGDFLWRIPRWAVACLVVLACLLVGFLSQVLVNLTWGILALVGGMGGWAVASLLAFRSGVMLDLVAIEASIFIVFATVTYVNFLRERRSKRRIRLMFQYYLDPSLVDSLITDAGNLQLGGEARVCTVYFSDIVGFTAISEKLTPEQVVEMMNRYLGEMTDIILSQGGLLDKYIGDAIMAVFGAPAKMPDHPAAACRTALRSHRRLAELSAQLSSQGLPALTCGIGINTGSMVVGNIGSASRGNYTAMGDAVNLASRLEGLTREFGTRTIIGPETRAALGQELVVRELDFIRVKGKREPVRIFELVGEAENVGEEDRKRLAAFAEALSAYRSGQWEKALGLFEELSKRFPGDGPARTYLERSRTYSANPPEGEWDGVWVMLTK